MMVNIGGKDIRFFSIDEELFQNRFDAFFLALQMMEVKVECDEFYDRTSYDRTHYRIFASREDKYCRLSFSLLNGAVIEVVVATRDGSYDEKSIDVDNMEELLDELNELLVYI